MSRTLDALNAYPAADSAAVEAPLTRGPLRPRSADLIAPLVAAGAPGRRPSRVPAVDLPNGTGADDGTVDAPVLAAGLTGTLTDAVLAGRLHVPGDRDHKYTRGVVEVWAGSETYPGAAVLTCTAACRAGAGMVRLAAPRRVEDLVLARRPETVPVPGRHQALVVGPGTDPDDEPRASDLRRVLRTLMPTTPPSAPAAPLPAVIDAGALPLLPDLLAEGRLTPTAVLTPHAGEAASFLSALGRPTVRSEAEDPATAPALARELACRTGACVLLKGAPTLVATPSGDTVALDSGPGWLATAGSGDVLAGVLGTLLAAEQAFAEQARAEQDGAATRSVGTAWLPDGAGLLAEPDVAACAALAVRVHALAGAIASGTALPSSAARWPGPAMGLPGPAVGRPITALDVAGAVPAAVEHLLSLVGESRP